MLPTVDTNELDHFRVARLYPVRAAPSMGRILEKHCL